MNIQRKTIAERVANRLNGRVIGTLLGSFVAVGLWAVSSGAIQAFRSAFIATVAILAIVCVINGIELMRCGRQLRRISGGIVGRLRQRRLTVFEIFSMYAGDRVALHDALFALCALEAAGIVEIIGVGSGGAELPRDGQDVRAADLVRLRSRVVNGHLETVAWPLASSIPVLRSALSGYELLLEQQCRAFHAVRVALWSSSGPSPRRVDVTRAQSITLGIVPDKVSGAA